MPDTPRIPFPNEELPDPARFWWFKRLLIAGALFLTIFGLEHWIVARHLDAIIRQHFASARARGEPVLISDYRHEWPPDDQNAAILLMQAANKLSPNSFKEDDFLYSFKPNSATPLELAKFKALIEKDIQALTLVRQARGRPFVDWHIQYTSPGLFTQFGFLNGARSLCHRLRYAALYAQATGDEAETIGYLWDMVFLANAVDRDPSSLVQHLVGVGCDAGAADTLQTCIPTMTLQSAAARQSARELLADLTNEERFGTAARDAIFGERATMRGLVEFMRTYGWEGFQVMAGNSSPVFAPPPEPNWPVRIVLWAYDPVVERDELTKFNFDTAVAKAVASPDYPTAMAAMPADIRDKVTFVVVILMPSYNKFLTVEYHWRFDRRAAAITLAAKLYEADHGRAPATLAQMIPDYLPRIPLDPQAGGGKPMPYVPATQPTTSPGMR